MISSNAIFQSLVETSVYLNNEDLGAIAGDAFDRQLGRFNALQGLKNQIARQELFARANTIAVYCGFKALKAYCQELDEEGISTPYRLSADQVESIDRDHEGMRFLAVMDVYEMAKIGANLGWKRQWCPFRGPAETLWHAAFRREVFDGRLRAAGVLLEEQIARFHSDNATEFGQRAN